MKNLLQIYGQFAGHWSNCGVSRGLVVAVVLSLVMLPFVHLEVHHFGFLLLHAFAASMMLSLLGLLTAIWAEKFDQLISRGRDRAKTNA